MTICACGWTSCWAGWTSSRRAAWAGSCRKHPLARSCWSSCTGNSGALAGNNPLWVARYSSTVGTLPAGWGFYTIWQFADAGTFPGDQDRFNGALDRVQAYAKG